MESKTITSAHILMAHITKATPDSKVENESPPLIGRNSKEFVTMVESTTDKEVPLIAMMEYMQGQHTKFTYIYIY